jgi:hypothetical protein
VRFAVKHPRWEPSALIGHARICAGGRHGGSPLADLVAFSHLHVSQIRGPPAQPNDGGRDAHY